MPIHATIILIALPSSAIILCTIILAIKAFQGPGEKVAPPAQRTSAAEVEAASSKLDSPDAQDAAPAKSESPAPLPPPEQHPEQQPEQQPKLPDVESPPLVAAGLLPPLQRPGSPQKLDPLSRSPQKLDPLPDVAAGAAPSPELTPSPESAPSPTGKLPPLPAAPAALEPPA